MDNLQKSTNVFASLLHKEYLITVGKNQTLESFIFKFNKEDYKHVFGFHKLRDLDIIRRASSSKLFDSVHSGELTSKDFMKSGNFYALNARIQNLCLLEYFMDQFKQIYKWNNNDTPFSKIQADLMIANVLNTDSNEKAYIFFGSKDGKNFHILDYFTQTAKIENTVTFIVDRKDYSMGLSRPSALLYKEKMDKTTGKQTILFDRLSNQQLTDIKSPSPTSFSQSEKKLGIFEDLERIRQEQEAAHKKEPKPPNISPAKPKR